MDIIIYDECEVCKCPNNPYHKKNGCKGAPVKNNCVSATYNSYVDFRCPYDLKKAHEWWIKWNTLYVQVKEGGKVEDFSPTDDFSQDMKRPIETYICDEDDIGYECDDCGS